MKRTTWYLSLLVILLGIGLRWYGINWALPNMFHPDETRLLYAMNDLSFEDRDFNPDFFAYGSLPIYLLKIVYEASKALISPRTNFFLVGRTLSALWGSLTLVFVYLLGKHFFSSRVAFLATSFLAFTVLHIQLSHLLTVDVFLTFLVVFALYWMAALVNRSTPFRHYLLAGVAIGLAMATKISALPLYGVFLGAHVFMLLRWRWDRASFGSLSPRSILRRTRHPFLWLWGMLGMALLLSGLVFAICEPYALLDFQEFYRQITEQSKMVRGIIQPPYTIQYEGTPAYLYPLQQLLFYSMGVPLGLFVLTGTFFLIFETLFTLQSLPRNVRTFPKTLVLLVLWALPVFLITGGFNVKFLRYMLPLIPFLCLFGAIWVDQILRRFPAWKVFILTSVFAVIGYSAFYSLAFLSIYSREDPRVQMSRWVYEHVKPGATVLTELWEFVSLVPLDGHHPGQYRTEGMDLYSPDTEPKLRKLAHQLSEADAVILATKRVYGSILRVPERYPFTTRYYQQLFDGTLGFGTVKVFVNYPSLAGVTFNDDFADESFSVYEHPKTIVFQKTFGLSADQIYQRITATPPVEHPEKLLNRLLAFPAQETPRAAEVLATPSMAPSPTSSWLATVLWLVAIEMLALIAVPWTFLLFRHLPDAGYSVAKVLGIVLPGYVVWLLVSVDVVPFTRQTIIWTLVALGIFATAVIIRFLPYYLAQFRQKWRIFIFQEGVFLILFCSFLLFRAYNPDIFWSESSMDFSFLNVLVRAESFPPPDPWFSGTPLNYYYFGHYLVAMLTKLTHLAPQLTYNLAFAFIPALVGAEVFSVLYALTRRYVWGWIGVLFATILGNLDGFFLLLATWRTRIPVLDAFIGKEPWLDTLIGTEHYYRIFRPAHEVIQYTVHEFPFWTFIFVDLHAHLLNMPLLIASFLVGLNLLSPPSSSMSRAMHTVASSKGVSLLTVFMTTLLIGTLGVISSWDYPTSVIFLALCIIFTIVRSYQTFQYASDSAWRQLALFIVVIIPGSFLLYNPFYAGFSRSGMGIEWVGAQTTALSAFLTVFGFFLWVILGYLLLLFSRLHISLKAWIAPWATAIATVGCWVIIHRWFDRDYATLLFSLYLVALSGYLLFKSQFFTPYSRQSDRSNPYVILCLIYACLITVGCDIVFVQDFLQGGEYKRMNTIFKFYLPGWYFLAIVAAYAVYTLWRHAKQSPRFPSVVVARCFLGFAAILFIMSAVFPSVSSYSRRHSDFYRRYPVAPTLNGLAFLTLKNIDEYQAIRWLNEHVSGMPVILEAVHDDYKYDYARISANTGLPTVLGWPSHADQREHWGKTHQRRRDVTDIYATTDAQHAYSLLQHYQVRYVYVGRTEQNDFSAEQLRKFDDFPDYFTEVFRSGETVIYEVK